MVGSVTSVHSVAAAIQRRTSHPPLDTAQQAAAEATRKVVEARQTSAARAEDLAMLSGSGLSPVQLAAAEVQAADGADSRAVFDAVIKHAAAFEGGVAAEVRHAAGSASTVGASLKGARAFAAYRTVQAQWDATQAMIRVKG